MDIGQMVKKLGMKKIILILVLGLLMIYIITPTAKVQETVSREVEEDSNEKSASEYAKEQENKLREIVENLDGVDAADVMITLKSSKEEVILKDTPYVSEQNREDEVYESREETVMIEEAEGNQVPYVVKELNPQVEGIVVVVKSDYQGIEKDINDIVLALFDVPVHKIKVMKMN